VRGIAVEAATAPNVTGAPRRRGRAKPEYPHVNGRPIDPREVNERLEALDAEQVIEWAIESFHPSLYFACSFQKTTSVVIDIAQRIEPATRFFYLDTDLLFEQTYATRDALAARYGIGFDRFHNISVEEQGRLYGDKLWERQPDACCGIRKVEPMREALAGIDCWVSGVRRVDSRTRAGAAKFGWDKRFGLWKLNPLADWTDEEVWSYISDRDVPYNPLHDAGYPSIGCTHCTRPPGNGAGSRDGRWANAEKTECGLN
jgi:phosphoadenosine phosphosulfate reductase